MIRGICFFLFTALTFAQDAGTVLGLMVSATTLRNTAKIEPPLRVIAPGVFDGEGRAVERPQYLKESDGPATRPTLGEWGKERV